MFSKIQSRGGDIMKKIAIELFVIALSLLPYALALAEDGGW
jgi:hypothetical protein